MAVAEAWRQNGTGRARSVSPDHPYGLLRTTFGPTRDILRMPFGRREALLSALSLKIVKASHLRRKF